MEVWDIFRDCKSGIDFENTVVKFLRCLAFEANRTGKDDGGIDIVATTNILSTKYTFYIQCKYFNTPLGKHPIQEVYAGTNYYGGNGKPVVITNNKVTVGGLTMSDFFGELMESIDSLTEEQVNALLSKLEVKRAGSQKIQEESKDEQAPMACPHCGSISIKKHGRKSGRQRYYCKDCHKTFVETSNCIQYRSRLTPAQWRGLLLGMVQNLSLSQIADIIGASITTVWQNRQKVCMALQEAFGLISVGFTQ